VFIASPVLVHWKEREPVYRARHRRIAEQFGGLVPAYAVATAGAPTDVEPGRKRRAERSITAPTDPTQVSRSDLDDTVRNLGIEDKPAHKPEGPPQGDAPAPDDTQKPKKPRNRRHGRPC
jgi:SecD/SecF fusion protein